MKRIEINLMPETCDDLAHAERVLARLRVELPPLLPEGYILNAKLYVETPGQKWELWLPDTDPNDPEYDRISELAYDMMDRIRAEEEGAGRVASCCLEVEDQLELGMSFGLGMLGSKS